MSNEEWAGLRWNSSCGSSGAVGGGRSLLAARASPAGSSSTSHHQGLLAQAVEAFPSGSSIFTPGTHEINTMGKLIIALDERMIYKEG